MDAYKIYTNTGSHVACACLSDTVITKMLTRVGGRLFALGWVVPGMNCAENRECFLHIIAQEMINLNVTLVYLNLMCILILKAIFGWKRCALYLCKYGIFSFWALNFYKFEHIPKYLNIKSVYDCFVDKEKKILCLSTWEYVGACIKSFIWNF